MNDLRDLELPADLSSEDRRALLNLLSAAPPGKPPLNQLWHVMDQIWDGMGLDNLRPDPERLAQYYQHPVWLLNGLFSESDPESIGHRRAVAEWFWTKKQQGLINRVLEFGGGFGTLARLIAEANASVEVLEPYPHPLALLRSRRFPGVSYVAEPRPPYDALVAMDVLEHVLNPAALLLEMINTVHTGGWLIFQNHFAPSIKCHLPATFHLNQSFDSLARLCGLEPRGQILGSWAFVYEKIDNHHPNRILLAAFLFRSRWRFNHSQDLARIRRILRIVSLRHWGRS